MGAFTVPVWQATARYMTDPTRPCCSLSQLLLPLPTYPMIRCPELAVFLIWYGSCCVLPCEQSPIKNLLSFWKTVTDFNPTVVTGCCRCYRRNKNSGMPPSAERDNELHFSDLLEKLIVICHKELAPEKWKTVLTLSCFLTSSEIFTTSHWSGYIPQSLTYFTKSTQVTLKLF